MPNFDDILGKKLSFVRLEKAGTQVVFKFLDGSSRKFGCEGDWIDIDKPRQLQGAIIYSVIDGRREIIFRTDRGDIVISSTGSPFGDV